MNNPYWLLDSNENSYEALNEDQPNTYNRWNAGVTALYLLPKQD